VEEALRARGVPRSMSGHQYTATVRWERDGAAFSDRRYHRAHTWSFDGGAVVQASSSPLVVRLPLSDPGAVDPEEAFIASVSSCHMLFFLDYAAQAGFVVDGYVDVAIGTMGKTDDGREYLETIVLAPQIMFSGALYPTPNDIAALHERAHHDCYIANSIKTTVVIASGAPQGA
jgi:organic hydroperoxide reductase OsmC/OhrA